MARDELPTSVAERLMRWERLDPNLAPEKTALLTFVWV